MRMCQLVRISLDRSAQRAASTHAALARTTPRAAHPTRAHAYSARRIRPLRPAHRSSKWKARLASKTAPVKLGIMIRTSAHRLLGVHSVCRVWLAQPAQAQGRPCVVYPLIQDTIAPPSAQTMCAAALMLAWAAQRVAPTARRPHLAAAPTTISHAGPASPAYTACSVRTKRITTIKLRRTRQTPPVNRAAGLKTANCPSVAPLLSPCC